MGKFPFTRSPTLRTLNNQYRKYKKVKQNMLKVIALEN
jgi:hypothetical protein